MKIDTVSIHDARFERVSRCEAGKQSSHTSRRSDWRQENKGAFALIIPRNNRVKVKSVTQEWNNRI